MHFEVRENPLWVTEDMLLPCKCVSQSPSLRADCRSASDAAFFLCSPRTLYTSDSSTGNNQWELVTEAAHAFLTCLVIKNELHNHALRHFSRLGNNQVWYVQHRHVININEPVNKCSTTVACVPVLEMFSCLKLHISETSPKQESVCAVPWGAATGTFCIPASF